VYCWPCLLLQKKSIWSSEGYNNYKSLSWSASLHCSSKEQIQNKVSLKHLEHEETPCEQRHLAILQYNDNVRKSREVFKPLIDISVVLSRQELAFHGHDETADSINQGNYREPFDYFFCHSNEPRAHWQRNSTVFSGLSKTIQNKLIECMAEEIWLHIERLKSAAFFACEVDKTTDISQLSQLSLALCYVDKNRKPQERMSVFVEVQLVMDSVIFKHDYKTKLVSQSYDDTAVMAGELVGLQALIKLKVPQAFFVHCFAHRKRIFFATLNGFPKFFTHSSKQSELLDKIVSRIISLHVAILSEREPLCDVLQEIVDGPDWDGQALGYFGSLTHFQFLFLAFSYCNTFSIVDILYYILQKKAVDVNHCIQQITKTTERIQDLHKEEWSKEVFNDVATAIAGLPQPTHKHRQQHRSFEDNERTYSKLYYEIIGSIIMQLTLMFADIMALHFLELANPSRFPAFSKQFPSGTFTSLANLYDSYFDLDCLKNEFGVIFNDNQFQKCSVCNILHIIIETELCEVLKETLPLLLVGTIPATMVSVERSFSCLKHIKIYLRSTMDQGHFSVLATISIEKELLSFLEKQPTWYGDVITRFASKKDSQLDLLFK
uniref:DUF4371 domain-containing protein n=1 Tax=Latimeria chalumnae TaxID=7897 RepID=H3AY79_LATCH